MGNLVKLDASPEHRHHNPDIESRAKAAKVEITQDDKKGLPADPIKKMWTAITNTEYSPDTAAESDTPKFSKDLKRSLIA